MSLVSMETHCTWAEGSEVKPLLFLFHTEEFGWLGQSEGQSQRREVSPSLLFSEIGLLNVNLSPDKTYLHLKTTKVEQVLAFKFLLNYKYKYRNILYFKYKILIIILLHYNYWCIHVLISLK